MDVIIDLVDRRRGFDGDDHARWLDVVAGLGVIIGAAGVWWALAGLAWATRRSGGGVEETITRGPSAALRTSLVVSIVAVGLTSVLAWRWLRAVLVVSGLVVLTLAVVEALSSIAVANEDARGLGRTTTSYGPGAIVGVLSAGLLVLAAAAGLFATPAHGPPTAGVESAGASS